MSTRPSEGTGIACVYSDDAHDLHDGMFTAKQYRDKAAEYAERGKSADGSKAAGEFARLERNFTALADNEEWLCQTYARAVRTPAAEPFAISGLADQEEHILRCIGAAVIMEWRELPAEIRRKLFDCAIAMGDVLDTPALRQRIARFLQKHQDGKTR